MKSTPAIRAFVIVIAVIHIVLVALCFGAAILNPIRSSLMPLIVFFADIPASFVCEVVRDTVHEVTSDSYTGRLLVDAFVYAVLGTAWWGALAWCFALFYTKFVFGRRLSK